MFISHKELVELTLQEKCEAILSIWGMMCSRYAQLNAPVDTGNLRNSIDYKVNLSDASVEIGSNVEYAIYQEFGTSRMRASNHGRGYLRPAVNDHIQEYHDIAERILRQ